MESNPTSCPKCSYIRKETDDTPLWKCPQCGIVYEKYVAMMAARSTSDTAATPKPSEYINTVPAALSTNLGTRSSRIQKLATGMVIGLFLLVVMSFFGYREYGAYRLRQQLTPFLTDTTARIVRVNAAYCETYGSGVVDKNYKAVLQQHILEIENNLLNMRKLSTDSNRETIGPVIRYVEASKDYVINTQNAIYWGMLATQDSILELHEIDSFKNTVELAQKSSMDSSWMLVAQQATPKLLELNRNSMKTHKEHFRSMNAQIDALKAIGALGNDLVKEFGRDALLNEQAFKGALRLHREAFQKANKKSSGSSVELSLTLLYAKISVSD